MEAHEEVQKWVTELERGKAWLEGQRANWERTAEEREKTIQEQQAWMGELEQGKAWLEEQYASWRRVAEESEQEQSRSCTLLWRARI
jgi:exonuclease VII small subunit